MAKPSGKRSTPVEPETDTPDNEAYVDKDESAVTEASTTEETPEAPAAETTTDETTEPAEPTAAELQAKLEAQEIELAALKAKQTEPKPDAVPATGGAKDVAIDHFKTQIAPTLKAILVNEKATLSERYEAVYGLVSHGVGSVLQDKVYPNIASLAIANLKLTNELEIRDLRTDDARFKGLEPLIRKEMETLSWDEREKPGAVRRIFHRIVGERSNGKAPMKTAPVTTTASSVGKVLKDVSAGTGTPTVTGTVTGLTADQKHDLETMNEGRDNAMTPQIYQSKLKARRDKIKAQNEGKPADEQRTLPRYLRESV